MEEITINTSEEFINILKKVKEFCEKSDCSNCPLSVGIYQESLKYTYYFCDIRKKPKEWDLENTRIKQDKDYKKKLEKEKNKEDKPKKPRKKKKDTENNK